MLIRNRKTKQIENIRDITIKHNGPFTDLINRSTCEFFASNTDPKIFFLELLDKKDGKTHTRKYNITSTENLHGLLADIRFRLLGKQGYIVTRFRTFYKPEQLIEDEQNNLTYGVIQEPVSYTVIFDYTITKENE